MGRAGENPKAVYDRSKSPVKKEKEGYREEERDEA